MSTNEDDHPKPAQKKEELVQQVEALQKAAKAQEAAQSLRDKASSITDPKKREKLIRDAYEKEIEAHGQSKLARRLQSGAWQGLAGGGGIGAGVGVGLGTVVGVVTGGLVSLPTTALGALIGSGVGAVHGPWIKLGGQDKKLMDVPAEELVDAMEEKGNSQGTQPATAEITQATPVKKKPRKLEVRSGQKSEDNTATAESGVSDTPQRGKPRKLDRRSSSSHHGPG